jgi:hypothetical protein
MMQDITPSQAEALAVRALLFLRRMGEYKRIKRICKGELAVVEEIENGNTELARR